MEKSQKLNDNRIKELEEKVLNLTLKLKEKECELVTVNEANKLRVSKISHNLKNPVGVIYSFSDMMLESLEKYTPEKLEKHITIIKKSAEFSLTLLNAIAKITQLQNSTTAFLYKNIDYLPFLNSIIDEFKETCNEKNIKIIKNFPQAQLMIYASDDEITIAIYNMLHNAFRYSKDNGTVEIAVIEHENKIETVIADQGIGLEPNDLAKVFNEFYVVNTYSEDGQKCLGLGLTIANKIVQFHKGDISISSTFNEGTIIKFKLPKN
ncbi:sensor histidine kinase KdpD [Lutibacter sp.]|uniref:sensor histidine kinase n=1 Tax=Lutibacter sp. TaxID=1925666 RepID=UPI0027325953|nr:HAMP domain-containing sensor histidine kinase [Lutibacter sp.]MDP3312774.1 HAMP domain-containing sensor histidine kinase [Lutibacter sp.]